MNDFDLAQGGLGACRACGAPLRVSVVDLGASPLANAFVRPENARAAEPFYELHALYCDACHLVQLPAVETRESIFNEEYPYFSSYSKSVVAHAEAYVAAMTARFGIGPASRVVEIASNDGYLLQFFAAAGVPVLGIEPSRSVADAAIAKGVDTRVRFFGVETAEALAAEGWRADLLLGANVLAHVPDLNDFVGGLAIALAPGGVVTMEFPHLLQTIEKLYYDQIYHEHFSYLSLLSVDALFARHGLTVFDVEEIAPQGGSLRVFARHAADAARHPVTSRVADLIARERAVGLDSAARYARFAAEVRRTKRDLLRFLIDAAEQGKSVAGYGAPAKGVTLLNYCGVKTDLLPYTVDVSRAKQGRLMPGTRIPIHAPDMIMRTRPDYVLILPWNIRDEIMASMSGISAWGGRFVVPLPRVEILG